MQRQSRGLLSQALDFGGVRLRARDKPTAAEARHEIEPEPIGRGRLRDSAGRAKAASGERSGESLQRRNATESHSRKELEPVEAKIQSPHDIGGGGDAG